tara:strand:- start:56 stop:889 length:834 start_codon:yes stop_codon:yes gene_type:complete
MVWEELSEFLTSQKLKRIKTLPHVINLEGSEYCAYFSQRKRKKAGLDGEEAGKGNEEGEDKGGFKSPIPWLTRRHSKEFVTKKESMTVEDEKERMGNMDAETDDKEMKVEREGAEKGKTGGKGKEWDESLNNPMGERVKKRRSWILEAVPKEKKKNGSKIKKEKEGEVELSDKEKQTKSKKNSSGRGSAQNSRTDRERRSSVTEKEMTTSSSFSTTPAVLLSASATESNHASSCPELTAAEMRLDCPAFRGAKKIKEIVVMKRFNSRKLPHLLSIEV